MKLTTKSALFLIIILIASSVPAISAGLIVTSSSYVPDREFPNLMPYVLEGFGLKEQMGAAKSYAEEFRPGATIHVYVRNTSAQPVEIKSVLLNGVDLAKQIVPRGREDQGILAANYVLNGEKETPPDVRAKLDALGAPIWYQARPNPIPAGGFSEVTVRLRYLPREKSLAISLPDAGVTAQIPPAKPQMLSIASVSFGEQLDRVYVYLRRNDGKDFEVETIQLDGWDVALKGKPFVTSSRGFLPVEIPLREPRKYGAYLHVAATTTEGLSAAGMVRVREPFFALGMWGYRNRGETVADQARDTCAAFRDHLFNTHMGMAGAHGDYLVSEDGLKMLQEMGLRLMSRDPSHPDIRNPWIYARFLMDEPESHDYSVSELPDELRVGSFGQGLVERQRKWTAVDDRTLTLLNLDSTYKPAGWLVYGQIPDILCCDPYYQETLNSVTFGKHPGRFGWFSSPYSVYGMSDIMRWCAEPRPTHIILNSVSRADEPKFRYGTPEEKRIEFYYALAAGAKGISYWWFTPYGECKGCGTDEPDAIAMMKEMARLNAEARAVEPLLSTACPGMITDTKTDPFMTTAPYWLMARTLLRGTDTAIVVLVNRDHMSDRVGTIYKPIPKAPLTFTKPPWMKASTAFRVSKSGIQNVPLTVQGDVVKATLMDLDLAELLIVTDNASLEGEARGRWEQNLPRLKAILGE